MSYDIYFLRRRPGQSWEDAMDILEEEAEDDEELSRPEQWDQVVTGVRVILGDVTVADRPPDWEIDDQKTAIQVSCYAGEWSMTVPYWYDGERAEAIACQLLAIAGLICDATGLEAYDPQTEVEVTSSAWTPAKAATVFDQVAESFNQRGIR
ncbi:MAG: hypothetical protein ACRDN0_00295 [Trebonia sp.]